MRDIRSLTLAAGAALVLAGCGGGGKDKAAAPNSPSTGQPSAGQSSGSQSKSSEPSSEQTHAAGIPSSNGDQKAYFMRVYCVGDSQAQCKCKLEVMGGNDEGTFGTVLYKLKRSDAATVLRFGRASTGCA
ncbi:MAG: hypothetical protein M3Z33_03065 [Actinomycetota bacterium]|nr:hypothetical protein [Actinomycetota bacterium]